MGLPQEALGKLPEEEENLQMVAAVMMTQPAGVGKPRQEEGQLKVMAVVKQVLTVEALPMQESMGAETPQLKVAATLGAMVVAKPEVEIAVGTEAGQRPQPAEEIEEAEL